MLKKAVAYHRVSSKEQEEEGFSIAAQKKLLCEYALKNGMDIVKEFENSETAKTTGREQFSEMIRYMQETSIRILICEKTDRLYRNFRDYIIVDDLDVEIHLVKENEIISKDSKSHQKFIHGIKVLMAKNYIDNLSEEVKKGLYEKAESGEYPGQAPTGLLNVVTDDKRHIMVTDGERAPLVKRLFEMYASANYTLDDLHGWAKENGLWSKYGKPLSRANIERILKNQVYYGDFFYSGKLYHGTHEPIVTKELWDRVQIVFKRRNKNNSKRRDDFLYTGLLTCADCGCSIVAEMKKGRYVYYHCSKAKKECSLQKSYVREEVISKQLEEAVYSIKMTPDTIDSIVKTLKDSYADKNRFRDAEIASLRDKIDKLRARIDQSYIDKLDGKISEDFWQSNTNRWQDESRTLGNRLTAYSKADIPYYENGKIILELARNAHTLYQRATRDEKRKILRLILSNSRLNGSTVEYQIRNPFHNFVKWASRPALLRG